MDLNAIANALLNNSGTIAAALAPWAASEIVRFLPGKSNSLVELFGRVLIWLGNGIVDRAAKVDAGDPMKPEDIKEAAIARQQSAVSKGNFPQ